MGRSYIAVGSLAGLLAVAMSAYAAHGLGWLDPAGMQMVRSAVDMQGWHALALVATGMWMPRGGRLAAMAGAAFIAGIVLFCGDVYALALGRLHLGVAPLGGVLLMLGWAVLGASALRARS